MSMQVSFILKIKIDYTLVSIGKLVEIGGKNYNIYSKLKYLFKKYKFLILIYMFVLFCNYYLEKNIVNKIYYSNIFFFSVF